MAGTVVAGVGTDNQDQNGKPGQLDTFYYVARLTRTCAARPKVVMRVRSVASRRDSGSTAFDRCYR